MAPGPFAMLVGYLLMGALPILVRLAVLAGWTAPTTVVARFAIGCALVLGLALFAGQELKTQNPSALLGRGLLGGSAVLTYFAAVEMTSAGIGTLLNYTHSIWANVFAVLLLGARPPRRFWVWLCVAVIGMWLVVNPSFTDVGWGELVGVLSGLLGGGAVLTIKRLRKTDGALTILASFSLFGLLVALPFVPLAGGPSRSPPPLAGYLYLLGIGATSFAGQWLFNHGFKETSVQLGSVLSLLVPVMAVTSGWLVLGEPVTIRVAAGAALIVSACLLAALEDGGLSPRGADAPIESGV